MEPSLCSNADGHQSSPPQRRHPPQLFRQMEQEDTQSPQVSEGIFAFDGKKAEDADNTVSIHNQTKPSTRVRTIQHLPLTQDSQASSSTESAAAAMSICTSGGSGSSASKSGGSGGDDCSNRIRKPNPPSNRGTPVTASGMHCSSSASSSTEETEARERRFGSLALHPLPKMPSTSATVRRSFIPQPSVVHMQQYTALLAIQQHLIAQSHMQAVGGGNVSQPSVPTIAHQFNISSTALSSSTLSATPLMTGTSRTDTFPAGEQLPSHQGDNSSHDASYALHLSRLLCPVHAGSLISQPTVFLQALKNAVNQETNTGDSRTAVSPSRPMAELSLESDRVVMTGEQVKDVVTSTSLTRESSDWVNNKPPALISPRDNTLVSPSPPTASFARIGPYELGPTLGRGNFAVVKLAKHIPTKMKVAIKIMNKELVGTNNLSKVSRELEAMKRCQHPHIVRLYHVMETESKIFMVTEFASKGEVFDRISISRAFNEKEARELFWQIVCAIDFCHNSGVVHRDLKAENLLLDDQFRIKVADFGFCNFFQPDELLSTHCGSPQYAAPELFKGEPYDGPLADVWSLGVILYILVCGSFPFPGESLGDIRSQVLRGLVRFPFFLSTECEQMIRCMLQVDPSRRFKLKQVISTAWMQASPNVAHYRAMMAKYEAKAKCRLFDELFERQYPEHSEVAKADRIRLAEQKLDSGILRALALGAGLDEEEVRLSVLQNKCDRLHAAYQLFLEKVRRFKSNPHLRQAVNDALVQGVNQSSAVRRRTGLLNWRSSIGSRGSIEGALRSPEVSDGSCVRRNTQLATVPDVIDEAMTESEDDAALGRRSSGQSSVIIHPVYSVNSRRDSCHGSAPLPANNSPNVSLEAKCADSSLQTTSKGNSSERSDKDWHDPLRPNSLDFHVAMIILKADEDEILAELGLTPTAPMNPVVTNAMRRHTVQLTGSPLPPLRPSPEQVGGGFGTGDSKGEKASNARQTKDANQTGNANSEAPNANQQSPKSRVATYPLPRQVTQPSISVLRKARHPEQFLRAALDWMPNPWGWGLQRTDKLGGLGSDTPARKSRGSPEPQHLPSLDLGQEAATTKQPNARVRPGLQRRNSVQEEYDEEEQEVEPTNRQQFPSGKSLEPSSFKTILERQKSVDRPSPSPVDTSMQAVGSDNQKFGLGVAGVPRVTIQLRQQSKDSERKSNAHLESEVSHAEVGGVKPAAMETDVSETSPESKETNATVLGGASCWPPGREAEDAEVDTEADVLGTLLPQLNLPANLPPMIHQPVGRFTVKDPHLLAPPEFMTPQCSSFPRRSSDGAAELQPLHRPALAVGGSYPEPANYRNKLSSAGSENNPLSGTQMPPSANPPNAADSMHVVENLPPVSSSQTPQQVGTSTTDSHPQPTSVGPRAVDSRMTDISKHRVRSTLRAMHSPNSKPRQTPLVVSHRMPAMHAAQQRSFFTALRCLRTNPVSWWHSSGPKPDEVEELAEKDLESNEKAAAQAQFDRHQKRFSLPGGYRLIKVPSADRSVPDQELMCLCDQPLTSEFIQQIQHLMTLQIGQVALQTTSDSLRREMTSGAEENIYARRGSEASQMFEWKQRLDQYGSLYNAGIRDHMPMSSHPVSAALSPVDHMDPSGHLNSSSMPFPPVPLFNASNSNSNNNPPNAVKFSSEAKPNQLSVSARLESTSPPGIELGELKTELYKLESEGQISTEPRSKSASSDDRAAALGVGSPPPPICSSPQTPFHFQPHVSVPNKVQISLGDRESPLPEVFRDSPVELVTPWPHRGSSLKARSRAFSAIAASAGRGQLSRSSVESPQLTSVQYRRHRYSVGDSLDQTSSLSGHEQDSSCPPVSLGYSSVVQPVNLSDQYSTSRLQSQQHRTVGLTWSNPDPAFSHRFFHGVHQSPPVLDSDLDRTALSSPGASNELKPPGGAGLNHHRTASANSPNTDPGMCMGAPASAGVKRRLLGQLHQKPHDYLRTLQHVGGSLDRRLNLDFLTSPKRKVYQEWLPKVTAFSRKAAATVLQAVHASSPVPSPVDDSPSVTGAHPDHSAAPLSPVNVSSLGYSHSMSLESSASGTHSNDGMNPCTASMSTKSSDTSLANMEQESEEDQEGNDGDEEDEKNCAVAPLQSDRLPLNTSFGAHLVRNRSNMAGTTLLSPLVDPVFPSYPSSFSGAAATSQLPHPLGQLPSASGLRIPTGLSGATAPVYELTDLQSLPAAAVAAASLMMLRPGDDDEDLAEIDRVNQRLAMGKLSGFNAVGDSISAGGDSDARVYRFATYVPAPAPPVNSNSATSYPVSEIMPPPSRQPQERPQR